jgi:hypothetical protein
MQTAFLTGTGGMIDTLTAPEDSPVLGALTVGEIVDDSDGRPDDYNRTAVAAVTGAL